MGDRKLVVNAPSVVSEIIDGEVVIVHLTSGHYCSSDQSGAVLWGWIEEGRTAGEIVQLASSRYDAPPAEIAAAMTAFLDRLIHEGLVHETPTNEHASVDDGRREPPEPCIRERFASPELHVYTDMHDLLMLDPIHDVEDAGWPTARRENLGGTA